MHKWAKEIADALKNNVNSIGVDNFCGQDLDDLKDWTEIIKNIVCFDKNYKIIETMEKSENDDILYYTQKYGEYPKMNKKMYEYDPTYMRDMDRTSGKMYYTEPHHIESRYESSKRNYTEMKNTNPSDTTVTLSNLEEYFKSISDDMSEMIPKMNPNEKQMTKQKLQVLMQKVG